jgi:Na+/phosphate symporter
LEQIFPYTIGANTGTTVTAMLAALSTGNPAAVTVAIAHLLFNVSAGVIIYVPPPMRAIPLALARWLGQIGSRNRWLAGAYIAVVFYGLPILLLVFSGTLSGGDTSTETSAPPGSIQPQDPQDPAAGVLYFGFDPSGNRYV